MVIPKHTAKSIRAALNSGKATADEISILDQGLASAEVGIDVDPRIYSECERLTGARLGFIPIVDR